MLVRSRKAELRALHRVQDLTDCWASPRRLNCRDGAMTSWSRCRTNLMAMLRWFQKRLIERWYVVARDENLRRTGAGPGDRRATAAAITAPARGPARPGSARLYRLATGRPGGRFGRRGAAPRAAAEGERPRSFVTISSTPESPWLERDGGDTERRRRERSDETRWGVRESSCRRGRRRRERHSAKVDDQPQTDQRRRRHLSRRRRRVARSGSAGWAREAPPGSSRSDTRRRCRTSPLQGRRADDTVAPKMGPARGALARKPPAGGGGCWFRRGGQCAARARDRTLASGAGAVRWFDAVAEHRDLLERPVGDAARAWTTSSARFAARRRGRRGPETSSAPRSPRRTRRG